MKHKDMITHPEEWPLWPLLPMKKRMVEGQVGLSPLGFLIAEDGLYSKDGEITLFEGLMYAPDLKALPRTKYANVDALLADGWMVD